jgi:tetratricopeptide (TPR) repeat protein
VKVCRGAASVTFWVVPHVLGEVMQARVVLRQNGTVLAEVPLKMRVVKQGVTLLLGALSLLLPLGLMMLKHFRLDFESQLEDGFGLYAAAAHWAVRSLSPEALMGLLLAATGGAYFWLRPRKRDVFWDIEPEGSADPTGPPEDLRREWEKLGAFVGDRLLSSTDRFARAKQLLKEGDCEAALELYEEGLAEKPRLANVYYEAGVAAYKLGDFARAFLILRTAEERLGATQLTGPMWYNLGCLASRLGRFDEAIRYLNQAIDAGYANPRKYRHDPDLMSLRWRPEFKRLLGELQVR